MLSESTFKTVHMFAYCKDALFKSLETNLTFFIRKLNNSDFYEIKRHYTAYAFETGEVSTTILLDLPEYSVVLFSFL
jgi:hypothetical protein